MGVTIDSKLSSVNHVTNQCFKTSQKLHALSKAASHMSFDKRRILLQTFITLQFNYGPLTCICGYVINLHEHTLRILYQNKSQILKLWLKMTCLLQPSKPSSWWRRGEDVFSVTFLSSKTSARRFLEDILKASCKHACMTS